MKSLAWIVAIIASGLLLGHLASRMANRNAAISATASHTAPYQIGDRLAASASAASSTPAVSAPLATHAVTAPVSAYREILWDALMPADWDPMLPFKGLKLNKMQDDDPRANAALEKARQYWDRAPVNPKMNAVAVKIPGFVVSLEREGDALKEFLVVPYYGGCIHVPPPPANQIIHVHSATAIPGIRTMDAVWISGTLQVSTTATMMGVAGYSMQANKVELYTGDPAEAL